MVGAGVKACTKADGAQFEAIASNFLAASETASEDEVGAGELLTVPLAGAGALEEEAVGSGSTRPPRSCCTETNHLCMERGLIDPGLAIPTALEPESTTSGGVLISRSIRLGLEERPFKPHGQVQSRMHRNVRSRFVPEACESLLQLSCLCVALTG